MTERVCESCETGQIEDETHFMLKCTAYQDLRDELWKEFEASTRTRKESFTSETEKLNALIGDKFQPKESDEKDSAEWRVYREIVMTVMMFITRAMNRRRGLQK